MLVIVYARHTFSVLRSIKIFDSPTLRFDLPTLTPALLKVFLGGGRAKMSPPPPETGDPSYATTNNDGIK